MHLACRPDDDTRDRLNCFHAQRRNCGAVQHMGLATQAGGCDIVSQTSDRCGQATERSAIRPKIEPIL